jgi:probable rRNA maturation factor
MPDREPTITVCNRQRVVRIKLETLQDFAECALWQCLKLSGRKSGVLPGLEEVSVIFVSNRRMEELHRRFLQESGATDVITFQHGEIVISTETARSQAGRFGTSLEHELRLYIAHGLLHLRGFDDKTPSGAEEMNRLQEKLVASCR